MSRRKVRRDGIADYVTQKLAWREADGLLQKGTVGGVAYRVDELLEMAEHLQQLGHTNDILDTLFTALRRNELRALFDSAFDEHGDPRDQRSCSDCGKPLPRRPAGSPGRRAKYCTSACRQRAYRCRRGGRPQRVESTAVMLYRLKKLELLLLQESAFSVVDNRWTPASDA
ncbi:hypothetical protein NONO_c20980 [Nocardia nova SH22a]|uniref:Uncharacterized protein n=1 Tax=Nocardia nova SH22a TaxID=1415166 RepID=W5TI62_9NOCA|nr:hypothetical protein [Nocardia nova]AHH16896.1 hypothetical protein NONO_c20980 [Nocardia nova SH22a]